jgi:hypothetical protein
MTTDTLHPLAADYLQRLRRAGRNLPAARRRELLAEIEAHLSEAIEPGAPDAQALTVLDKLGAPEAIIAAEAPPRDGPAERPGVTKWVTIVLLLLGGFALGVGWIAGVVLLWSSRAWTARDKWIGTLVIPGGLATGVIVGLIATATPRKQFCRVMADGARHCTNAGGQSGGSVLGYAAFALLVLAPVATSVYLARRAA